MPPAHIATQYPIRRGSHKSRGDGMCAMEMVAWLAGERHSDGPRCTSPVIAAFVRALNDAIPTDAGRSYYLRSWIPRLINTRSNAAEERRRALMVVDHLVRAFLPLLLRDQGRFDAAAELANLRPIDDNTCAILAGLAVKQEAQHERAAWAIKQAARARAASNWVPEVVKVIEEIGTPEAYEMGMRLLGRLVKLPQPRQQLAANTVCE